MKNLLLAIIVLVCLSATTNPSDLIEVFVPDKRINVQSSEINIVGITKAPIVEILLNGVTYKQIKIKDSIFHEKVNFGFGLHEIKVIPIISGMTVSETAYETIEIMYAPLIARKYKRLYGDYYFHNTGPKPECLSCHPSESEDYTSVDNESTCLECHISIKETFSKHTEADDKSCALCHVFKTKSKSSFVGESFDKNPCFNCHTDKIKSFDKEYVHGPVAGGSCIICHSPHGSKFKKNLNAPQGILCVSCHDDIEDQMNMTILHKPFIEGNCSDCHDPHSTNNKWILKKSSEEICMSCHSPESLADHKHPFKGKLKKKSQAKVDLTEKGHLECLSCHNPHSSKQPFMIKSDEAFTCRKCHLEML